ncbi:ATP8B3 isoform 9, partial [Pan troglodytes]
GFACELLSENMLILEEKEIRTSCWCPCGRSRAPWCRT